MHYNDENERKIVNSAARSVEEGELYASLLEHQGWKLLEEQFLRPKLSRDLFLNAPENELSQIRQRMLAYRDLLQFIQNKINAGNLGAKLLSELKIDSHPK